MVSSHLCVSHNHYDFWEARDFFRFGCPSRTVFMGMPIRVCLPYKSSTPPSCPLSILRRNFIATIFFVSDCFVHYFFRHFLSIQTSSKAVKPERRKYVQRLSYWHRLNFADSFCCFRLKLRPILSQWHVKQWLQHLNCATSFYPVGDDSLFKFGLKNRLSYKVFTLCDKFSSIQTLFRTMHFGFCSLCRVLRLHCKSEGGRKREKTAWWINEFLQEKTD